MHQTPIRTRQCANEILERFISFTNIFVSDEAHFPMNEHVNRRNCRYWSDTNPKLKHQKRLLKVTAWETLSAKSITSL